MITAYLIGIILIFLLIKNDPRVKAPLLSALCWPLALPLMIISIICFSGVAINEGVKKTNNGKGVYSVLLTIISRLIMLSLLVFILFLGSVYLFYEKYAKIPERPVIRAELERFIALELDLSDVDTSEIKDFSYLFDEKTIEKRIKEIDYFKYLLPIYKDIFKHPYYDDHGLSNWDVSNGENFNYTFGNKYSSYGSFFEDVHLWNVKKAKYWEGFYINEMSNNLKIPCKFSKSSIYDNPCKLDTDGDGVVDHIEIYNNTNPLLPSSF